ncbi:MAG: hypothetical protein J6P19_08565 [Acetobacter sp.]|nr:hypothetical protein [Acetobacter sp.]
MNIEKIIAKTTPFDPADYLNSQNKMQGFLTLAMRNRKRNKKGLCEAFKVVVRAGCLNNPEKKEYFTAFSEPLLQEGTPEALRKIAQVLGLKVPSSFGKPIRRKRKASVVYMNFTPQQTQHLHVQAG